MDFKPGQKWISNAEPELGMGAVTRLEGRLVSVFFNLTGEERTYSRTQAPLTRVRFNAGDEISTQDNLVIKVASVVEREGLYVYQGDLNGTNTAVIETELDPNVRFSKSEDRLFTHQLDDNHWFNLRYHTLNHAVQLAGAKSRGLYGPRVSLIPHQLYIANEVAQRFAPRVLLADEVGLGKTIEAGLIIHQQLQTGRAQRILVIVPHALTFQWFVEMIRRFNLQFTVLDEERCMQIEQDNAPGFSDEFQNNDINLTNPFDAQQLMLCSLNLFSENEVRLAQVLDTDWDLVVIDEAHHLRWTPEGSSPEYEIVASISLASKGLLLLTATPEQLGRAGHFARLRLLDPHRFHDYEAFLNEETKLESVAENVRLLLEGDQKTTMAVKIAFGAEDKSAEDLVQSLLDQHGTGRVLFRNVRSSIQGFPQRILASYPLATPPDFAKDEFYPEFMSKQWIDKDTRVSWLISRLEDSDEKHLVICAHKEVAIALDKKIKGATVIRSTVFHEDMNLVARDQSANYFSETFQGAQVMICSEIGSEGRNFQFASHLVLFDLPLGPDLLEQRIGRLDRIGQKNDVTIHVPYLTGTAMEKLFRWFHEGMDLFALPNPIAQILYDENFDQFLQTDLEPFISAIKLENKRRNEILNKGRDRLLELNSHRSDVSAPILTDILDNAGGDALEEYMEASFDLFGLESEPLGDHVHIVKPTESMQRNFSVSMETMDHFHYPELPEDGVRVTYDRQTALAREDVTFFTWENPIVQQAIDAVISDVTGNSTAIAIKHPKIKSGTLLTETLHVVDCVAPARLQVDRYLPPSVIRSVITPTLSNVASKLAYQSFNDDILEIPPETLSKIIDSQLSGIKEMLSKARDEAHQYLMDRKILATRQTKEALDTEIERLEYLMSVNPNVREEELDYLRVTQDLLLESITSADVRLDSIRVIIIA
mgnify:CR=1 FL=1